MFARNPCAGDGRPEFSGALQVYVYVNMFTYKLFYMSYKYIHGALQVYMYVVCMYTCIYIYIYIYCLSLNPKLNPKLNPSTRERVLWRSSLV